MEPTGDSDGTGGSVAGLEGEKGFLNELIAWAKRHYYHYTISVGTYSFYPVEGIMVNALTFTLFSLTAYYILRILVFLASCIDGLLRPTGKC